MVSCNDWSPAPNEPDGKLYRCVAFESSMRNETKPMVVCNGARTLFGVPRVRSSEPVSAGRRSRARVEDDPWQPRLKAVRNEPGSCPLIVGPPLPSPPLAGCRSGVASLHSRGCRPTPRPRPGPVQSSGQHLGDMSHEPNGKLGKRAALDVPTPNEPDRFRVRFPRREPRHLETSPPEVRPRAADQSRLAVRPRRSTPGPSGGG
jgi:hypothetical protein